jgi:WD40 repeat protein
MLAVGESDGSGQRIALWDLTTRRWAATLTNPRANQGYGLGVTSLAFSRDGILAAGDVNSRVYLWDAATRRLTATIAPPINTAAGNAFISKGSGDGGPYPAPGDFPQRVNVAFSPDGTSLAIDANFGYGTYVYGVATRNRLGTLSDPGGSFQAPSAVFSPDGTMLAVTENGHTYVWRQPRPRPAA